MKEIVKKDWEYTLYQTDNNQLILSVLCGTVGLYEVKIQLNPEEKSEFEKKGTEFLDNLAEDIRYDSDKYDNREIKES